MKIAFFHYYHSSAQRGLETYLDQLNLYTSKHHQTQIYQGPKKAYPPSHNLSLKRRFFLDKSSRQIAAWTLDCLSDLKHFNPDIVLALNGGWQSIILRLWTLVNRKKLIIPGQSGPGWDDRWNLFCSPDVFVCLTQAQLLWAKRQISRSKLVAIPNGVDLNFFSPSGKSIKLPIPSPVILVVAAAQDSKRVDTTIKAISTLPNISLLWIGAGPLEAKLKKLGVKLLGSRFHHLSLKHQQMPDYYRSADLFTLCSAKTEAFGIVYLEALASNLPVVATNDLSRRQIVGKAGLYVTNPQDVNEYALVLKQALAKKWGSLPRKQAQKFSWDKVIDQYLKLFNQLVSS